MHFTLADSCFFVQLILGPLNCIEIAPSDFPDLLQSITLPFRSMLSSLDSLIVVIVAESNGCIKQALLKCHQLSLHYSAIVVTRVFMETTYCISDCNAEIYWYLCRHSPDLHSNSLKATTPCELAVCLTSLLTSCVRILPAF